MIIETYFSKSDVYPDLKINDIVKLALRCRFLKSINISNININQTELKKVEECKYNIFFKEFNIKTISVNKYGTLRDCSILSIPLFKEQYIFSLDSDTYVSGFSRAEYYQDTFYSSLSLEVDFLTDLSRIFYFDYLNYVDEEPPKDSLAYQLLKHYFIDWKVKSIREYYSKEYLNDTSKKGYDFILELEYVEFIDSFNNVLYEEIGELNRKRFYND